MAMDPKQERALRDGTASEEDLPRRIDRESAREQEENPPVDERPRGRRRTAAIADVRVNQEAGTPVDQMAREMGAEPVPEMGRAPRNKGNGGTAPETDPAGRENDMERGKRLERGADPTIDARRGDETSEAGEEAPVPPREARRVMKARREHSKGDGNFPAPEPSPQLMDDERPEDRMPRDLPKSRDDRSAPKGNITAGQDERNPNLQTRDDERPGAPSRAFSLDAARDAAAMPNAAPRPRPIAEAKQRAGSTAGQVKDEPGRPEKAEKPKADRTPSMPRPRSRTVTKRAGTRPRATERTRGTTRRPTNLAARKGAAVKRAPAKRAVANRATAKRAAPKRGSSQRGAAKGTAPKRGSAKRAVSRRGGIQRAGTAAHRRTRAGRSGSRARLSR
jgi:hypothetical protein